MITYRNDRGAPAEPSNALYAFGTTEWRDLDAAVSWALERGAPGVIIVANRWAAASPGSS